MLIGRLGEAAPTLLLIRDKGGAVFGGIAHHPWKKTGTFYGRVLLICTANCAADLQLVARCCLGSVNCPFVCLRMSKVTSQG